VRRDDNAGRKGDAASEKTKEWPLLKATLSAGYRFHQMPLFYKVVMTLS